jgi:hypothetical protein
VPTGSEHRERDEWITIGLTSRAAPARDGDFRHRAYQGSAAREADPWTEQQWTAWKGRRKWTTCGGSGLHGRGGGSVGEAGESGRSGGFATWGAGVIRGRERNRDVGGRGESRRRGAWGISRRGARGIAAAGAVNVRVIRDH